jgi:hypothetical protein
MPSPRRFPPPWSIEEQAACYVVRDHSGQALVAYVYFEDGPGRRSGPGLRDGIGAARFHAYTPKDQNIATSTAPSHV